MRRPVRFHHTRLHRPRLQAEPTESNSRSQCGLRVFQTERRVRRAEQWAIGPAVPCSLCKWTGLVDHDLCEFELTDELGATPRVARACAIWKVPPAARAADPWGDARYALRALARNRGFTAVAVLTLSIGIGATNAIGTLANTILLAPLRSPGPIGSFASSKTIGLVAFRA